MNTFLNILEQMWLVTAEMSPYLLLGFAVAGVLSVLISPKWVERHLGGRGWWPSIKAAAFGVPLPLCSCGVIPVSASLRKHGASRGATSSFLLATPQTGIDSIMASWALLGPVFAIVRPLVAMISGIIGGGLIDLIAGNDPSPAPDAMDTDDDCHRETSERPTFLQRVRQVLRYAFLTLPADIAWSLTIGIALAGLITVLVDPGTFKPLLGGGIVAMLLMMIIGTPLYVCSTGSIPMAIGFMHMGASPGAALAFLIAGPATNAATIAVTWKLLGKKTAVIYLLTVAVTAVMAGLGFDFLFADAASAMIPGAHEHGTGSIGLIQHISGKILIAMLVISVLVKRFGNRPKVDLAGKTVLNIEGMSCSHCALAVADALRETAGVQNADVDLTGKLAVITGDNLDIDALIQAVVSIGYKASVQTIKEVLP